MKMNFKMVSFELRKKADPSGTAVLCTSHQQCRAQEHRTLHYGLTKLTKLGSVSSTFLPRNKYSGMPFLH